MEEIIAKIDAQYEFTKKEKGRIEKIVAICQKNKYQNEEWIRVQILLKKIINFHRISITFSKTTTN